VQIKNLFEEDDLDALFYSINKSQYLNNFSRVVCESVISGSRYQGSNTLEQLTFVAQPDQLDDDDARQL
jgi:hypothetical protein